jgi:hypothetical protein
VVKPGAEAVKPPGPETLPVSSPLTPMVCDNELTSTHELQDDEQLIDYSSSPECVDLEDN